jgi:hypothetical protein
MMGHGNLTVYRGSTPVVDGWHGSDDNRSVVDTLTHALAAAEDVDVTDLPPLYDAVDLDALERLFESHDGDSEMAAVFSFEYERWNAFVRADGRVRICDSTRRSVPAPVFSAEGD